MSETHSYRKTSAIVLVALLTLACALVLSACGGSESGNANKNTNTNTISNTQSNSNSNKSSDNANSSAKSSKADESTAEVVKEVPAGDKYGKGIHHVKMEIDGYDPITIELDADAAPVTVSNFCRLVEDKFYDGLTFYRFVDGFCMQGGSSNNSAAIVDDGQPSIVGEFTANGKKNKLADSFGKGTVAMARSGDPDSASTTFFVTLGNDENVSMSLNGQYAAFGSIDDAGMKIIDKVVSDHIGDVDDPMSGSITDVEKQAKIKSISIVD